MPDLSPGALLGDRFEIAGVLGRGGMATVYLARDRVRDERVALKVLHGHLAGQPASRDRLRRELAAAARIRHPRALVASELFEFEGTLALSMPLHPGGTLADEVATHGALGADALWRLGEDLAGALAEAHRAGVVHRDVSPGNVLMDRAQVGTLTDFGLARLDDAHTKTSTTALGTAGYAAPELLDGRRAGPASDLYGLGAVLYLAATGKAPFDGATPLAVMAKQAEGRFVPLATARPDLPEALRNTIEALIARDPAARPESARAVADACARREGLAAAPRPEPGPALPAVLALPSGTSAVVLREGQHQHQRRHRKRRSERRKQRAGLEAMVEGIAEKVEMTVRTAIGMPPGREPEVLLREAVAEEAGLPAEALREVPALFERQFRLVDGVSPEVAARLAEQAEALGFRAAVRPGAGAPPSEGPFAVRFFLGIAVIAMIVKGAPAWLAASLAFLALPFPLATAITVAMILLAVSLMRPGSWDSRVTHLPLAYGADLRPFLTAAYAKQAPKAPVAAAAPADPQTDLFLRTGERLAALEQAISSSAARLPGPAVLDLQATLGELRARARTIEAELRRLTEDARTRDSRAEEEAASRVSARLERLATRARAGEAVDASELAQLERAAAAHTERLAAAEQDEQRQIRLTAALLEIGAAAERSRRALLHEPEPARSVEDLLDRLKAEGRHAGAAMDEVADARRRAAARQAQGR